MDINYILEYTIKAFANGFAISAAYAFTKYYLQNYSPRKNSIIKAKTKEIVIQVCIFITISGILSFLVWHHLNNKFFCYWIILGIPSFAAIITVYDEDNRFTAKQREQHNSKVEKENNNSRQVDNYD